MPPEIATLDPPFRRNFGRLVLCCIKTDFCKQKTILQHFSRSTRFAFFCTAPNSKLQQNAYSVVKIGVDAAENEPSKVFYRESFSFIFTCPRDLIFTEAPRSEKPAALQRTGPSRAPDELLTVRSRPYRKKVTSLPYMSAV